MSENVGIVVTATRAYAASDLETMFRYMASDLEVLPDSSVFPEAVPLHGHDAYRKWLEEAATAWVRVEVEVREAFALSDGRVVLRQDWGGVGRGSGLRTSSSVSGIFTLRSGLIARIEWHFDHAEALKAVGLDE
jgi:ketosteroid isomerase-like protein